MIAPRKAFMNSYAQPFQKFFMMEQIEKGTVHQKVLINSLEWKTIEQSGTLLYNPTAKAISGVSWQNLDWEEVKTKFWCDGHVVGFSATSTL